MKPDANSFKYWIPYKSIIKEKDILCEWLFVGDKAFEEPFFDETILVCKRFAENRESKNNLIPVSSLVEWSHNINPVPPAAFIFHVSRCGSTMVSQLLSSCNTIIVLSEVPFFDEVLRLPENHGYNNAMLFSQALKFYSQKRLGNEKKVFVKLDSWHIFFQKELRKLYPGVPFILLYRTPDEVVRSLNKHPGIHCIPQIIEPHFFGINEKVITSDDFYDYPIRVIEKYLQAYMGVMERDENSFLVNYNQGLPDIIKEVGEITGMSFSEDEWKQMNGRLNFHSKYPDVPFSEERIQMTHDEKLARAFEWYHQLEKLRKTANNELT